MDLAPLALRLHNLVSIDAARSKWPPPITIEVALDVTLALGKAVLNRLASVDDLVKVGELVITPAVAAGMPPDAKAIVSLILAIDAEARMFGHSSLHGARSFLEGRLFSNHLFEEIALDTTEGQETLHRALTKIAEAAAPILH